MRNGTMNTNAGGTNLRSSRANLVSIIYKLQRRQDNNTVFCVTALINRVTQLIYDGSTHYGRRRPPRIPSR